MLRHRRKDDEGARAGEGSSSAGVVGHLQPLVRKAGRHRPQLHAPAEAGHRCDREVARGPANQLRAVAPRAVCVGSV
eukprot:3656808-Alexandrium_andersonii.AAC.1